MTSLSELGNKNPGALFVLKSLSSDDRKSLYALNIRGAQIWALYKDVCSFSIRSTSDLILSMHKDASVKRFIRGSERNVLDYLKTV